jgi:hypothetical protein
LPKASAALWARQLAISGAWCPAAAEIALGAGDEIAGHQPAALVQQLEEGMLPVGADLAPHDGVGLARQRLAVAPHRLAVGLHLQLLQEGRQKAQRLV